MSGEREKLIAALLTLGLEEKHGYGQPTAEDVADGLLQQGWTTNTNDPSNEDN